MSFKAIILLSRREDMTEDQFRNWWLTDHAPLARQLPSVRKIVFNVCDDTTDIDGISELWFDSETDFVAAYETDLGKRVAADSMAHVRSRTRLFVVETTVVGDQV
jgi:uncharacterized protein (TIGR02118 family)